MKSICKTCKKEFEHLASQRGKYCSKQCMEGRGKRIVIKQCVICAAQFETHCRHRPKTRCCSRPCQDKYTSQRLKAKIAAGEMKSPGAWNRGMISPKTYSIAAAQLWAWNRERRIRFPDWSNHPAAMRWEWAYRMRKRFNGDPNFRLLHTLRNRIRNAIYKNKGNRRRARKCSHTMTLIGCTISQFKQHIEDRFARGMSWDNYGLWHIDHRIPCAEFDLSKPSQQRQCFHYTNLQPLWSIDNMAKGDKVLRQQELISA